MSRDAKTALRDKLAAPVVLAYWLVLVGGLALYSATRTNALADAPLWAGCIGGTALGQVLALRNLRMWLAAIVVGAIPLFLSPFAPEWFGSHLWSAFIPAALCGYLSLGDRSSLAAFWFPAVIWMLTILEHVDARAESLGPDASGAILLAGLAVLFVAFLRAREYRRVGLWRGTGAQTLAETKSPTVLREAPGTRIARLLWLGAAASIAFGLTAWVAPHLWQREKLAGEHVAVAGAGDAAGDGTGYFALPCCPSSEELASRARVREYLDLVRTVEESPPRPGVDCQACTWGGGPLAWGERVDNALVDNMRVDAVPAHPANAPAPPPAPEAVPSVAVPDPVPVAEPVRVPEPVPVPPSANAPAPPPAPAPAIAPSPIRSRAPSTVIARAPKRVQRAPEPGWGFLPWALTIVSALLLFQLTNLALRPLRRLLTLRHLRRPYWKETVDQRVSNLWQLALVGLRDAGWRATTGEPARAFARRTAVDGMDECATVLERAQHGMGIDAADLDEMESAAVAAYRSARRKLGALAGMLSWLRWPLT